jgi:hypothetical protein
MEVMVMIFEMEAFSKELADKNVIFKSLIEQDDKIDEIMSVIHEEFQEQMKHTQSAIVLVSSNYDATYWQNTPGHYVNIWLYQEDTDLVLLAEPGNPEKNRTWIPLRYVYDALKLVSPYQYLAVAFYAEEANGWKWNGIDDNWNGRF